MSSLNGIRVLVVEDTFLVADSLRVLLAAYGGAVEAMVPSADKAFEALERTEVDVAILDIHLKGGKVYALAEHLAQIGVPFVFVTGYGEDPELPQRLAGVPKLEKPVDVERLIEVLQTLVEGSG